MFPTNDPLGALATPPVGRCRRISSNEQPNWNDGNNDMTRLDPGQVFSFPLLKGPGYISHIWFTSHAGGEGALNYLTLRIYYDGRTEPGVEVPLGDFFACGNKPARVESFPVQVSESGALTCYWRMPFAESCRLEITNDSPDMQTGLYWQVDYVELAGPLPPHTPYFHARYRQEYPAVMGRDYTIAEIEGRGKYIGTVMSVTLAQDGWFGEGDDFFYIDGEEIPSLQGTGTEDYFNDAWGFRGRYSLWFGQPWWTGDEAGDRGVCYRWHVLDPVNFDTSLKVAIEHKGNLPEAHEGFFVERPDFISSVAFWYQEGENDAAWERIPSYPERCVPWERHRLAESFLKVRTTGEGRLELGGAGLFESVPYVRWTGPDVGDTLTIPFDVDVSGRYVLRLRGYSGIQYSGYRVELDKLSLECDITFYGLEGEQEYRLGDLELGAGAHTLTLTTVISPGPGYVGFFTLDLLRLPPPAERKVKGPHERHFIKLALGSAIYRHRLVYKEMPAGLEQLVDQGLLDERFLKDENLYDLTSRLEGDALVVESTGPERWTHSWRGLDPRR